MAEEHRHPGPRLGDVDDGDVEELLEAFATVLPVSGLDDRIELAVVVEHGVHDAEGGEVALDVASHDSAPKVGVSPMIEVPAEAACLAARAMPSVMAGVVLTLTTRMRMV